jgi:ribA/ribD-fused uncharacterized protein
MNPEQRLADLIGIEESGGVVDYLFFWGHRPRRDGGVGAGCLSQWWPCGFTVDKTVYPSAEHWMMAGKARLFGDHEGLAAVLASASPGAAKAAGRKVRGFDEETWENARFELVATGNLAKFTQNGELREFLASTGSKVLVEASPRDRIWGIGLAGGHEDAARPSRWPGLNLLGFALMNVRDQL